MHIMFRFLQEYVSHLPLPRNISAKICNIFSRGFFSDVDSRAGRYDKVFVRYAILPNFSRYRYILRYFTELNYLIFYRLSASYLSILQTVHYTLILDIKTNIVFYSLNNKPRLVLDLGNDVFIKFWTFYQATMFLLNSGLFIRYGHVVKRYWANYIP